MKRIDKYRVLIEKTGPMKQQALIYASPQIRLEDSAVKQLVNTASIDDSAVVLATPDIHTGFGVPIGCVFASHHFISPSAVGYDINCGMRMLTTPFSKEDIDIHTLAKTISKEIPLGEGKSNISVTFPLLDSILASGLQAVPALAMSERRLEDAFDEDEFERDCACSEDGGCLAGNPDAVPHKAKERGRSQCATLGGGNHFIEIQMVDSVFDPVIAKAFGIFPGQITVMIHSGSRGLGHQIAGDYMRSALQWNLDNHSTLPDKDLAHLPIDSKEGKTYFGAMNGAANFAYVNRLLMTMLVRKCVRSVAGSNIPLPSLYDVPHNIAKFENHFGTLYCVHRKGATRAFSPEEMRDTRFAETGQPVLIPGSMGTASYVLAGIPSGAESLFSVNHGAGRTMSRTAAAGISRKGKRIREAAISDDQFNQSMNGVFLVCENRRNIKEEAPAAYKDIDEIIAIVTGAGLAKAVARMIPLAVLKG